LSACLVLPSEISSKPLTSKRSAKFVAMFAASLKFGLGKKLDVGSKLLKLKRFTAVAFQGTKVTVANNAYVKAFLTSMRIS
jgi:hypothetical protein